MSLPLLYVIVRRVDLPLGVSRRDWPELAKLTLTLTNMIVSHVLAIVAVQALPSGRAAILGHTLHVFSALWGAVLQGRRLTQRQGVGVAAAAHGVGCLRWHEMV